MTRIVLVGTDEPLLEGLVQSLSAIGHTVQIAHSLAEAREASATAATLVAVVDRALATGAGGPTLGIPLAPGGALVLFHTAGSPNAGLLPPLRRHVLAELTLPLERNRLVALTQFVEDRARATGRGAPAEAPDELRKQ